MTSRKKSEDHYDEDAATAVPTAIPSGPVPGVIVVVNRQPHPIDITLTDGTNLSVGPKGSKFNESRAVPRKLLPPYVSRLAREGKVLIRAAG